MIAPPGGPAAHEPHRVPVGWRPGAGCIVIGVLLPVVFVATCVALIVVLVIWQGNSRHAHVPGDARPEGFTRLARWDSCGATGEWCAEVILFGGNGASFDDAVHDIDVRYREKNWTVKTLSTGGASVGTLMMSSGDNESCIMLSKFTMAGYVRDIAAPDEPTIERLIEPYSVVIEVVASSCA